MLKLCTREKGKKCKAFTLHHCWMELENKEKWKNREAYEAPRKNSKSSIENATMVGGGDDDDASSDEEGKRSPTPNSVAPTRRPGGRRNGKEKVMKAGDNNMKESLDSIMNARKEMGEETKNMKIKELKERTAAEQRKAAVEERWDAAEERLAATELQKDVAEERKVAVEVRKVAMEEKKIQATEQDQKLMFMDTSGFNEKQKAYIEICRDQVLTMKSMGMMGGFMGGGMGAMGDGMEGGMCVSWVAAWEEAWVPWEAAWED